MKKALTFPPVLAFPDMSRTFILTTDASCKAISYILGQRDSDGREHVIEYGGRALRGSEFNYSVSELECLAVVEGVKAYHPYLAAGHFEIYTDHQALTYLQRIIVSTGRLAHWAILL